MSAPDPLTIGATFAGRYLVEAVLGQGGMGRVYRVFDRALDERVALKALTVPERDEVALERFKREVRLARRITHRNVARTFDFGECDGIYYLTLELLHGVSLRELVKQGVPPFSEALRIAAEIADGLAAAHEAGVLHRDLKPQNVHIEPSGRVVLVDFGVARSTRGDARATLGAAVGTPAYMAPEQLSGEAVDARADLFALGIVVHLLLAGKLPTWGGSERDPIARLSGEKAVLQLNGVPPALVTLCSELLESDPARRPASAHDVAVHLRSFLGAPTVVELEQATTELAAFAPMPEAGPVVAVLPFQERGGESGLGAALAEELVDTLSRVGGLRVLASRATARFDSTAEPDRVGKELGADSIIDGTAIRSGDRVRVTARLIEVKTGFQRWTERFDGAFTDVLTMQEQIAQRVAEALRLELAVRATEDAVPPDALALYLEGRNELRSFSLEGVEALERAVARAPSFRPAVAALALASVRRHFIVQRARLADERASALSALNRALSLAPGFPETQLAAGIASAQQGDYVTGTRHLRFALKLAPTYPDAQEYLGMLQCEGGMTAEGIPRLLAAMKLDPGLTLAPGAIGRHYLLHGQDEEFPAMLAESDRRSGPGTPPSLFLRLRWAAWRGDRAAAEAVGKAVQPGTGADLFRIFARCASGVALDEESVHALEEWPTQFAMPRFLALSHQICAESFGAAGDSERCFRHVALAAEAALIDVEWLDLCPLLAGARTLPGYEEIARAVHDRARAVWIA